MLTITFVFHMDPTFDTLKNPLHGTAGQYKPGPSRHHDVTLYGLANSSDDPTGGGSHESISRDSLDELLCNVKNRYDAEDNHIL